MITTRLCEISLGHLAKFCVQTSGQLRGIIVDSDPETAFRRSRHVRSNELFDTNINIDTAENGSSEVRGRGYLADPKVNLADLSFPELEEKQLCARVVYKRPKSLYMNKSRDPRS